ncbi:MAG: hypothetical protein HY717_19380 [Planctomycetes bacterium]|nr:hypothetical protein [Planctomycetota bacterium]
MNSSGLHHPTFTEALKFWLKLGFIGFLRWNWNIIWFVLLSGLASLLLKGLAP